MRITTKMMTTDYMSNLNSSLRELNRLSTQNATGRSYEKASEDPATALKAYKVRENLSRISLYEDNVTEADTILTDVESAYKELNSLLTDIAEKISAGRSDTSSAEDRTTLAAILRTYQAEILDISNTKSTDKYIFSGSDMTIKPFTVDAGILYYHGTDVDSDTVFAEDPLYYDMGMGLEIDETTGKVVSGTAFDVASCGNEVFGTGTDADGITNNLYNLIGDLADMFASNDLTNLDAYVTKLESVSDDILVKYTEIGVKTDFLDFLTTRLEDSQANYQKKQSLLESVDTADAAVAYSAQKTAYEAALAMGSKLIQYSLLDYLD